MKRCVPAKKRACFCVISIALGAAIGVSGADTIVPLSTNTGPDCERKIEEWINVLDAASDRQAKKNYEERDTEVTPWLKDAALPNPDNAALLYYQAFLLRPEPNMAISSQINQILKGAEPDRRIRIYLGHCLPMIRVAEVASQIPQCTWGIWYGPETGFGIDSLGVEIRHLRYILAVDARTLAADGHYRAALARCLTIRRLARHVGDETVIAYLTSRQTDSMGLSSIQHVLGIMLPDASTLGWLRGQLAVVHGAPQALGKTLQADFESVLHTLPTNLKQRGNDKSMLVQKDQGEQTAESPRSLTDEEFLAHAREPYRHFLNCVFRVMDSDETYDWKHERIKGLIGRLQEEHGHEVAGGYVISFCAGRLLEWYELQVGHEAHINGIKAAVEVYLVVAKTGRLPRELPDHLPKDPFTGRDFVYEITDEGFTLRCQSEEVPQRKDLEFKVRK